MLELSQQEGFDKQEEVEFNRVDNVYTAFNVIKIAARKQVRRSEASDEILLTFRSSSASESRGALRRYPQRAGSAFTRCRSQLPSDRTKGSAALRFHEGRMGEGGFLARADSSLAEDAWVECGVPMTTMRT